MRDQERPFKKSGFTEIRHSAVDDDTGIEHLRADRVPGQLEKLLLGTRKLFLSEPRPEHQAEIGKPEKKDQSADVEQESLDVENLAPDPFNQPGQQQPQRQPAGPPDNNAE